VPDAKVLRARADKAANALPEPTPIDGKAVAEAVVLEQINVTIASTGRPFLLGIPQGMTDSELLEVMGWMGTALRNHLVQQRAQTAGGRIIVPGRH
jgi:hypothetical protein